MSRASFSFEAPRRRNTFVVTNASLGRAVSCIAANALLEKEVTIYLFVLPMSAIPYTCILGVSVSKLDKKSGYLEGGFS